MDKTVDTNINAEATHQEPPAQSDNTTPQPAVEFLTPAEIEARNQEQQQDNEPEQETVAATLVGEGAVYIAPEGVTSNDVLVELQDLIITLPDGTELRIENALNEFLYVEIGDLYFPLGGAGGLGDPVSQDQLNFEPAAGGPGSSGGNFLANPGSIDDAFDLTALLPPTALAFGLPQQEELNQFLISDDTPILGTPANLLTDDDDTIDGISSDTGQVSVDFGNDAPVDLGAAFVLSADGLNGQLTTIDGAPVVFTLDQATGDLVGSAGGQEVIRISVEGFVDNGSGQVVYSYQVVQNSPLEHTGGEDLQAVLESVGFTVTDESGDSVDGSFNVTVSDSVPLAQDDTFNQAGEDTVVTGNVRDNDTDGADTDANVTAFDLQQGKGVLNVIADGSFTYEPSEGEEGSVVFTYDLTDADGDVSTATVTIVLEDDSTPDVDWDGIAGDEVTVDEAALDDGSNPASDAESASGTITYDTGNDDLATMVVDGVDVTNGGVVNGQYGTLTVTENNGVYTWDYVLNDNTTDHPINSTGGDEGISEDFTVTITDSDGDEATDTLTATVLDDVPTAEDDSYNQDAENDPVAGDVSTNDVEGADNPGSFALVANSLTGDGDLVFNADGTFTYTPAAGEEGEVTFEYDLTDTDGDVSTATVTLVLNDDSTPIAGEARDLNLDDDDVEANGSDTAQGVVTIDYGNDSAGATFDLSLDGLAGSLQTLDGNDVVWTLENGSIVGRAQADNSVVIQIDVVANDNGDGTVTYTYDVTQNVPLSHPVVDSEDDVSITVNFTGTDGDDGDEVDGSFDVTINDSLPDAVDDSYNQPSENADVTGNVLDNDDDGADGTAVVTGFDNLSGTGNLVLNPNGTFTYTPGAGEEGSVTFDYTIVDEDGDTDTATVTLNLQEDSTPTLSVVDREVFEKSLPEGTSEQSDGIPDNDNGEFDSGDITITTGGDTIGSVTVDGVVAEDGDTFNGDYGILTINVDQNGDYSWNYELTTNVDHSNGPVVDEFEIGVVDSDSDEASDTLTINITNDIPIANDDGVYQVAENTPIDITDAFDNDLFGADGVDTTDANDVFIVNNPTKGTVDYDETTGIFTYTPDDNESGLDQFDYRITDSDGNTSTATITVNIAEDSTPEVGEASNLNTDDDDVVDTDQGDVIVDFGNDAAGATFDFNLNGLAGTLQTLDGQNVIWSLENGSIVGRAQADNSVVIQIDVVANDNGDGTVTYTYDVTQNDPLSHPTADVEDNEVITVNFGGQDGDGSAYNGSFSVTINDSLPDAVNDSYNQVDFGGEDQQVFGNVLDNDDDGADGTAVVTGSNLTQGTGNLVVNPDGSFTYDQAVGETGQIIFTYDIVDEDGDTDIATVTIDLVADSTPEVGEASNLNTDDDDVVDTDQGDVIVDFGNDAAGATFDFNLNGLAGTLQTLDGQNVIWSLENGSIVGRAQADNSVVIQIDVVANDNGDGTVTYTYDVTQNDPLSHPTADVEDDAVITVNFGGQDGDGDVYSGDFTVTINDSLPEAFDNVFNQAGEDQLVLGNFLNDDDDGADGTAVVTGISNQVGGGTVVWNPDGSFTFEPDPGQSGVVTFDYTIVDEDGDTSTATVTINLVGDSTPTLEVGSGEVDEAGLTAGTDEASDNIPDNVDSEFDNGSFTITTGNDTIGSLTVDGDPVAASGDTVFNGSYGTLTVTGDGAGNYTWVYELTTNVDHTGGAVTDDFNVVLTDSDGDPVNDTLSINILNDAPIANDDGVYQVSEDTPLNITDAFDNDLFGADGVDTTDITDVFVSVDGGKGTAVYNGDGTFTYTPDQGAEGSDTFTYTITDSDGNTDTAVVSVNIGDVSPPQVTANNALVDEDGLVPDGEGPASLATDTSLLTVDFDNDVPADLLAAVVFDATTVTALNGSFVSGPDPVVFAVEGGDIVGRADGDEVIRVSLTNPVNNNGVVTYDIVTTLFGPFNHADATSEDSLTLTGLSIIATDNDGNSDNDTFDVVVGDDVPESLTGVDLEIQNMDPSGDTQNINFEAGADGDGGPLGGIVFSGGTDGDPVLDTNGNPILSAGQPVVWQGFGTDQLVGVIEGTNTAVLTVDLNVDGTWSAEVNGDFSNTNSIEFTNLSSVGGGNVDVRAIGASDGLNNSQDVDVILVGFGGSVNTNNTGIGIGQAQSFTDDEAVRLDFVQGAQAVNTNFGFDWAALVYTNAFEQVIDEVQGSQQETASILVLAYETDSSLVALDPLTADDEVFIDAADVYILDENGVDITNSFGGSISQDGNGVLITGLQQGESYGFTTADDFNSVYVEAAPQNGDSNFDLGIFTLGTAVTADDFAIDLGVTGTDADGDSIDGTLTINVDADQDGSFDPPVQLLQSATLSSEELSLASFGEPEAVEEGSSVEFSTTEFFEADSVDISELLGGEHSGRGHSFGRDTGQETDNLSMNSGVQSDLDDILGLGTGSGS